MKKKLLALGAAAVFALTGLFAAACDNDSQQNTGSDDPQQEQGSDDIQKDPDDGKGDDVKERELRVLREGFTYKIDLWECMGSPKKRQISCEIPRRHPLPRL